MKMRSYLVSIIALFVMCISCKKEEQTFTISGEVVGSHDEILYLERMGLDKTEVIDSVNLKKEGLFSFTKSNGGENPEFYRLRIADRHIAFIADSTDQIKLHTTFRAFGEEHQMTGSPYSTNLLEVDKLIQNVNETIARYEKRAHLGVISYNAMRDSISIILTLAKSDLRSKIIIMPQSPVSYYILYLKVFGTPIFDIEDSEDQKLFGAVVTNYEINYPKTIRAEYLKSQFLNALKARRSIRKSKERLDAIISNIQEKGNFEITLPNNRGEMIPLSSTNGKVTLLCFSALKADYSASLTAHMGEIYSSMKGKPFEIYHVCFDADENFWRNSSSNLPWICVRERTLWNSPLITQYNIQQLPTLFLLDKKGDLIKRIEKIEELDSSIRKLL